MTHRTDLLGRPPVMRPLPERFEDPSRGYAHTPCVDGRIKALVPSESGMRHFEVTMPAAPWEASL